MPSSRSLHIYAVNSSEAPAASHRSHFHIPNLTSSRLNSQCTTTTTLSMITTLRPISTPSEIHHRRSSSHPTRSHSERNFQSQTGDIDTRQYYTTGRSIPRRPSPNQPDRTLDKSVDPHTSRFSLEAYFFSEHRVPFHPMSWSTTPPF